VKLTIVGCSPAWPNPGGAQSGYLLEGDGRLLLDCGPGVLARLRESAHWPSVDAIAITHFHLDHWGDLVPWVWGNMFGPGAEAARPALWLPPGGHPFGLADQLRVLPAQLRVFGRHLRRAIGAQRAVERHHPREPHWYLDYIAVAPGGQGRGAGSALLAPMLERCDREGVPAYLESSKERNLAFYARHGFRVAREIELPDGPPIWLMWRDPH
jgi:GNAT superfamily N-acetyltransferase